MSVQKASGEENLRANPSVKAGSGDKSPAKAGKDYGGTENLRANYRVHTAGKTQTTPGGGSDHRPAGLDHYDSLAGDR